MKAAVARCSSVSIVLLLFSMRPLAGSPASSEERGPSGTIAYYIEVETSEPGVRIEVDGEYVGMSPTKVKVFGDRDGTFHRFKNPKFEIRAIPTHAGQYPQVKSFSTGGFFVPDDHIPHRVYFDMGTPSEAGAPSAKPGSTPPDSKPSASPARQVRRSGSGFFISENGHFLTAFHLVNGATSVHAKVGGRMMAATLVRKDQAADLAILKVETNSIGLAIGPSKHAKLGEHVYSMGFPATEFLGEEPKFTEGSISSLAGFQDDWSQFQVSVPIYAGDSGSAVVNSHGTVIGVVVAKVRGAELVNYAVKSSRAILVLEDLPELKLATSDPDRQLASEEIAELLKRSSLIVVAE